MKFCYSGAVPDRSAPTSYLPPRELVSFALAELQRQGYTTPTAIANRANLIAERRELEQRISTAQVHRALYGDTRRRKGGRGGSGLGVPACELLLETAGVRIVRPRRQSKEPEA